MAGIGFVLRRLARQDNLLGPARALFHSMLVVAGPWLITVLTLALILVSNNNALYPGALSPFYLITTYNFGFSLVLTSPLCIIVTRYVADELYAKRTNAISGALCGGLLFTMLVLFVLGALFYFGHVQMSLELRYAALLSFILTGSVWFISVFVSAIRDYSSVSMAFALGFSLPVLTGFATKEMVEGRSLVMLVSMIAGQVVIIGILLGRILDSFPQPVSRPFGFIKYFRRYWELPLGALMLNGGAWVDKWIMWFSPHATLSPQGFLTHPSYDNAMFLANLSMVPVISFFVYSIETEIYENCIQFQQAVVGHANLKKIEEHRRKILQVVIAASRKLIVVQGTFAALLVFAAPRIFTYLHLPFVEMGIFRYGVVGSTFLAFILFQSVFFSYLDARLSAVWVQGLFFVLNAIMTLIALNLGTTYYGDGFMLAAFIAFIFGVGVLGTVLDKLPYYTFIRHNQAISQAQAKRQERVKAAA